MNEPNTNQPKTKCTCGRPIATEKEHAAAHNAGKCSFCFDFNHYIQAFEIGAVMTDLTTTQKIRVDLQAELQQVEEQTVTTNDVDILAEIGAKIRWLKSKLDFYNSEHYPEYKRQNGETQ